MLQISIDDRFARAVPDFALGLLEADSIRVTAHDAGLWQEIEARISEIVRTLSVGDVAAFPPVAGLRKAYRALGKDPTRYRGSQEALLRRVLKGKGLYRVNTAVDINNLISLESFHSVGAFDAARIGGPVVIRAGEPGETYHGIGRDLLNVEGLPLLADSQGPFGSPTSDSERTKVTLETTSIVAAVLSFSGPRRVLDHCRRMADLLARHCGAQPDQTRVRLITAHGAANP